MYMFPGKDALSDKLELIIFQQIGQRAGQQGEEVKINIFLQVQS